MQNTYYFKPLHTGTLTCEETEWDTERTFYLGEFTVTSNAGSDSKLGVLLSGNSGGAYGYLNINYTTDPQDKVFLPTRLCVFCDANPRKGHSIGVYHSVTEIPEGTTEELTHTSMVSRICPRCAEHFEEVRNLIYQKCSEKVISHQI